MARCVPTVLHVATFVAAWLLPSPFVRAADCNRNGLDDADEIAADPSLDCNTNGVPDDCDLLPRVFDLSQPVSFETMVGAPRWLAAADFDADGTPDLAVVGLWRDVSILLNRGDRSFWPAVTYPSGGSGAGVAAADLDGDGDLDLAVGVGLHTPQPGAIAVLHNRGDGTFESPVLFLTEVDDLFAVHAADLDGDSHPDLVYTGLYGDSVGILWNDGTGAFGLPDLVPAGTDPWGLAVGDVTGDGRLDVVAAGSEGVMVMVNAGARGFLAAGPFASGRSWSLALGDLDNDGDLDLALAPSGARGRGDPPLGWISVHWNNGANRAPDVPLYEPAVPVPGSPRVTRIAVDDVDADGDLDLITPGISVILNVGGGVFDAAMVFPAGGLRGLVVEDFDQDGFADVAVAGTGVVELAWNLAAPLSRDCDADRIPDECELSGDDCNTNGILDACEIAARDCNGNRWPDDCDIADGVSFDCNANHVPDECDIAAGRVADCNENGQPDSCDLTLGLSFDCNRNGVPDECDIGIGAASDDNRNGIPDECETLGDMDGDWDVDLADLLVVLSCMRGSGQPLEGDCVAADLDLDGDGDLADFLIWQTLYTGPQTLLVGPTSDAGPDRGAVGSASPVSVTLDGSGSQAGDNAIERFEWFEGGNLLGAGITVDVSLAFGTHVITLRVTDVRGLFDVDTVTIVAQQDGNRGR